MKSKYRNRETVVDGIRFDSLKEARRFGELRMLERAGEIKNLRLQVPYELIPAQYETFERYSPKTGKRLKDGKKLLERKITYVADFVYDKGGQTIVEDTKGMRTKEYIIKRKLMLYIHGIKIREI